MTDRAAIRAITFDLWDTVLIDDSDEPKRKLLSANVKRLIEEQKGATGRNVLEVTKKLA